MEQKSVQDVAKKISSAHGSHNNPDLYPRIDALLIQKPSRWYAFPILGGLIKLIILIPQFIILMVLGMVVGILVSYINPFVVLFTGKYMQAAYDLNILYMKWYMKVTFFSNGLTDKYPGFSSEIQDTYSISIPIPTHPSKFYAIPILGYLVRSIFMIPFSIWTSAILYASGYASIINSFYVLFRGKFSETTYELLVDSTRLHLAQQAYMAGLSETYPTFSISMNHKNKKIILISIGFIAYILFSLLWLVLQVLGAMGENSSQISNY